MWRASFRDYLTVTELETELWRACCKCYTQLFIIPLHVSQNLYIWMVENTSTCDPHVETPQVYLYVPREPGAYAQTLDRTQYRGRRGAASLATKIAWHNTMRFFFWGYAEGVFLPPLPQDRPELRRRIIAAVSMRRVWAWRSLLPLLPQDRPELRRRIIAAISMRRVWAWRSILPPLTQDRLELRRRIIAAVSMRRVWAELDCRLVGLPCRKERMYAKKQFESFSFHL